MPKFVITSLIGAISLYFIKQFAFSTPTKNLSPIKIAFPRFYSSSLAILAHEKGFFKKNGLDVRIDNLEYGRDCLEKMLEKEFDFSIAYVTPIANKIRAGKKLSILAELHHSSENTLILYRKDMVKDLKKDITKIKIGLVEGTNAEFLLSLFAGGNAVDYKELSTVNGSIPELEQKLLKGELAAAIFWQPLAYKLLSENPSILGKIKTPFYTDFSALIGNSDFIESHKEETYALMKSLVEAQNFFDSSTEEANKIILPYLRESPELLETSALKSINIDVRLSQMFVIMLESELKWMSRAKFKFLNMLDKESVIQNEFLKKYLPAKVTYE